MAKSRTTLKTYFETGDIPTEPQFIDLIDSLRHLKDGEVFISSRVENGKLYLTVTDTDNPDNPSGEKEIIVDQPRSNIDYVAKTGGDFTGRLQVINRDDFTGVYLGTDGEFNTSHKTPFGFYKGFSVEPKNDGSGKVGYQFRGVPKENSSGDQLLQIGTYQDSLIQNEVTSMQMFQPNSLFTIGGWIGAPGTGEGYKLGDKFRVINGNAEIDGELRVKSFKTSGPILINNVPVVTSNHSHTNIESKGRQDVKTGREVFDDGVHTYNVHASNTNKPPGMNYGASLVWGRGTAGSGELMVGWTSGDQNHLYFRSLRDTTDSWWSWKRIYHEGYKPTAAVVGALGINDKAKDSDKLDGINSTGFVRKGIDATNAWNGSYLIFSFADANNVDAISYNDSDNSFHFNADRAKTNTSANANVHAGEFRVIDTNTRLRRGGSNSLQIKTNSGYVDIGPQNDGWSHFSTDRANFYFNKGIHTNGDIKLYNSNTYMRKSDGAIFENGVRVATQNWVNAFFVGTGSSAKAKDSDKLDGLDSSAFLRSNANDTLTGMLSVGSTNSRQAGMYGIYDSTKTGHIWSMGTAYKIAANGSDFGNLYGFAYKHTNNATGGTMAGGHQAVWCENGNPKVALGNHIWTSGDVYANGSYYLGDGKRIVQFSDSWLRLNPSGHFSSGIYCGSSRLRTDGQFEVGPSGNKFKVETNGNTTVYGHLSGKSVNAQYSHLYRFGGIHFTWDSDSYGTNAQHSIRSTYGTSYGDSLTMNSYNNIRLNLDSNNNNSNSKFEIGHNTTGTSNVIFTVDESGNMTASGNVSAYSDKRLKKALKPVAESFLDKIDQLKPTYYQWRDKTKEQTQQLGFIAQDVMKIFPQWVQKTGDHYAMSYDKMGAVLAVKGIQELYAEVKSLKNELKELKYGVTN